jgi:hypothetical protein
MLRSSLTNQNNPSIDRKMSAGNNAQREAIRNVIGGPASGIFAILGLLKSTSTVRSYSKKVISRKRKRTVTTDDDSEIDDDPDWIEEEHGDVNEDEEDDMEDFSGEVVEYELDGDDDYDDEHESVGEVEDVLRKSDDVADEDDDFTKGDDTFLVDDDDDDQ